MRFGLEILTISEHLTDDKMNQTFKDLLARGLYFSSNRICFERSIFLLGHMRCGSTALSNVLCSNVQVQGYGECHITYNRGFSPGRLALNLVRNGINPYSGKYIFDKVLHGSLDSAVDRKFFRSKAIFMLRNPLSSVTSLVKLSKYLNLKVYMTVDGALGYYTTRLQELEKLWEEFPVANRSFIGYEALVANPQICLDRLSNGLLTGIKLNNEYSHNATLGHGRGDPLNANKYRLISNMDEKEAATDGVREQVRIAPRFEEAEMLHQRLSVLFGTPLD